MTWGLSKLCIYLMFINFIWLKKRPKHPVKTGISELNQHFQTKLINSKCIKICTLKTIII